MTTRKPLNKLQLTRDFTYAPPGTIITFNQAAALKHEWGYWLTTHIDIEEELTDQEVAHLAGAFINPAHVLRWGWAE